MFVFLHKCFLSVKEFATLRVLCIIVERKKVHVGISRQRYSFPRFFPDEPKARNRGGGQDVRFVTYSFSLPLITQMIAD